MSNWALSKSILEIDVACCFAWSWNIKHSTLSSEQTFGAGIAQLVVWWARCPAWCRFNPPLRIFSVYGIYNFSFGVNMGSDSIPQKSLSDENINLNLVYTYMHSIAWTQKILTFINFMSLMGECGQQEHTQLAQSIKMECDYLNGWIKKKKKSHMQKYHPTMVNPRDIAGEHWLYEASLDEVEQLLPISESESGKLGLCLFLCVCRVHQTSQHLCPA